MFTNPKVYKPQVILLFNIYINSLQTAVASRMIMSADDAVLICSASSPSELKEVLDRDFSLPISDWYTDNATA